MIYNYQNVLHMKWLIANTFKCNCIGFFIISLMEIVSFFKKIKIKSLYIKSSTGLNIRTQAVFMNDFFLVMIWSDKFHPFFTYFSVCDPKSLLFIFGMQLDYSDALIGGGFSFKNPNATKTCGCGKSFAADM